LSGLSQVSGYHAHFGIAVMAIDIVYACFEALVGIETMKGFPAWHEVQVRELDEFHGNNAVLNSGSLRHAVAYICIRPQSPIIINVANHRLVRLVPQRIGQSDHHGS
jgi:hypothetical protein